VSLGKGLGEIVERQPNCAPVAVRLCQLWIDLNCVIQIGERGSASFETAARPKN